MCCCAESVVNKLQVTTLLLIYSCWYTFICVLEYFYIIFVWFAFQKVMHILIGSYNPILHWCQNVFWFSRGPSSIHARVGDLKRIVRSRRVFSTITTSLVSYVYRLPPEAHLMGMAREIKYFLMKATHKSRFLRGPPLSIL